MSTEILAYNRKLSGEEKKICAALYKEINSVLPEAEKKIWHGHPVWFLDGNPVVGYSKLKECIRLLFWSGRTFKEDGLTNEGSFKAAEARYVSTGEIRKTNLRRWLKKSREIQWDYKNIVKRKGVLKRLR